MQEIHAQHEPDMLYVLNIVETYRYRLVQNVYLFLVFGIKNSLRQNFVFDTVFLYFLISKGE